MNIEDEPKAEDAAPVAETAYARGSAASARAVTHSHFDDGSELIVVGSEGFRSSSGAGGNDRRQDFQGHPAQGEDEVLQVCRSLQGALALQGETWDRFSPASSADDVDAVARNDAGAELRVQVTQVERAAWKTLAQARQATSQRSIEELVADIRTAVESKSRKHSPAQRCKLVLASTRSAPRAMCTNRCRQRSSPTTGNGRPGSGTRRSGLSDRRPC